MRIAVVEGSEAQSAAGVAKSPSLQVFRKFAGVLSGEEPESVSYDYSARSDLATFIKNAAFPLVGEISPSNFAMYEKRGQPFVWVFLPGPPLFSSEDESGKDGSTEVAAANKKVRESLRQVAKSFPDLSFVHLSGDEYRGKYQSCFNERSRETERGTCDTEHAGSLGVDADKLPSAVIMKLEGRDKYVFNSSSSFNHAEIAKWVKAYKDGTLSPTVKSEPIPEKNNGPVRVVVAKSLQSEVFQSDKDVFIEFYAPCELLLLPMDCGSVLTFDIG